MWICAKRFSLLGKHLARVRLSLFANMSMKAVVVQEYGDSSKLSYEDVPIPEPGPGEVLVKNHFAGLNFIDIAVRKGIMKMVALGGIMGFEGAGTVEKLGAEVQDLSLGDRVAFAFVGSNAYAQYSKVATKYAVKVPDSLSMEQVASTLWQGFTAHAFACSSYPIKAGDKILVHAAAGGVGSLIVQIAKNAGAFVIGTTSTEAKAAKAKDSGADEVILYSQKDFVEEVNRITDGKGVNVIYDGVGKTTFLKNFDCLARRGTVVVYGGASGPPDPLNVGTLAKGSSYVTFGHFLHFVEDPAEYKQRANELFSWLAEGKLKFSGGITVVPLADAKKAHDMLEGRHTTGKVLLQP
ncbi:quinone oxidoreductase-like [Porites lutea]|uniref:quinone oxidoreductase-like n=1 Tax=Porites lutea TaxID=51062 RepID=UPI003CC57870